MVVPPHDQTMKKVRQDHDRWILFRCRNPTAWVTGRGWRPSVVVSRSRHECCASFAVSQHAEGKRRCARSEWLHCSPRRWHSALASPAVKATTARARPDRPDRSCRRRGSPGPAGPTGPAGPAPSELLVDLNLMGRYSSGVFNRGAAEIVAYDADQQAAVRRQRQRRHGGRARTCPIPPTRCWSARSTPRPTVARPTASPCATAWWRSRSRRTVKTDPGVVVLRRDHAGGAQLRDRRRAAGHAHVHARTAQACWWPTRASPTSATRSTPRARSASSTCATAFVTPDRGHGELPGFDGSLAALRGRGRAHLRPERHRRAGPRARVRRGGTPTRAPPGSRCRRTTRSPCSTSLAAPR